MVQRSLTHILYSVHSRLKLLTSGSNRRSREQWSYLAATLLAWANTGQSGSETTMPRSMTWRSQLLHLWRWTCSASLLSVLTSVALAGIAPLLNCAPDGIKSELFTHSLAIIELAGATLRSHGGSILPSSMQPPTPLTWTWWKRLSTESIHSLDTSTPRCHKWAMLTTPTTPCTNLFSLSSQMMMVHFRI